MEFIFSIRDEPPEDGYSLGDLSLTGNSGSVSTRDFTHPDQRMMVYPSAADLLSEIRLLVDRQKGETVFEGIGSMFTVRFSLQKGVIETWHKKTKIDASPLTTFLNAAINGARSLLDHGKTTVQENRTVLDSLAERIRTFEEWQDSIEICQKSTPRNKRQKYRPPEF